APGMLDAVPRTLTSPTCLDRCRLTVSPACPPPATRELGTEVVALRNPLSEEWSVLRPSLLPGLLQAVDYNVRRGQESLFLFEVGWAHRQSDGDAPQDRFLLAGVMRGSRWSDGWNLPKGSLAA